LLLGGSPKAGLARRVSATQSSTIVVLYHSGAVVTVGDWLAGWLADGGKMDMSRGGSGAVPTKVEVGQANV